MLTRRIERPMEMTERDDISERRVRAVRTAWMLAVIAAAIFTAFVLSGVLGD